jgi:hypothetical protein
MSLPPVTDGAMPRYGRVFRVELNAIVARAFARRADGAAMLENKNFRCG